MLTNLYINALAGFDWTSVMYLAIGLIAGAVGGFFVTRYLFQKQLKENPPISEKQIRAMFIAMGQKPSEARVQQVLRSMGIEPTQTKKDTNTKTTKK